MRVPDLDWPADLYQDVIFPLVGSILNVEPPRMSLWPEMARAWMRDTKPGHRDSALAWR